MQEQPDPFLALIVIFLVTVVLASLVNWLFSSTSQPRALKGCELHKWSLNPVTDKLQCEVCNYVAGTHSTERGQY